MTTTSFGPRYLSLFLVAFAFNMFGTFYSWIATSIPRPPAKRAAAYGFINALGNSSSIWSTFLYKSNTAPYYRAAFGTIIGLQCITVVLAVILRQILIHQNKQLATIHGAAEDNMEVHTGVDEAEGVIMKGLPGKDRYLI